MKIFTIGFTRKSARGFFDLLQECGAERIVDVRLHNVSQLAGFAKRDDLAYFLGEICEIDYVHVPALAPTKEMLDDYRKGRSGWSTYEARFLDLMRERRVEKTVAKEIMAGGCLLCSEAMPDHCHRRLVVEYLDRHWRGIDITHL